MNEKDATRRLSVVIAVHNAREVIGACLTALAGQIDPRLDEIIIADSSDDGTRDVIKDTLKDCRWIHYDEPLPLSRLRGHGIAASKGEIIAILDPYSIVSPGWVNEVIKAHRDHANPVIGGTVDLYKENSQGLLAWAQYINEYGMFMSPVPEGEIEILPGSNISYKRHVLFEDGAPIYSEFWKTFINWKAETSGSALWLAPMIHVRLWKPIPFADFLRTRFDHGRCFASMRSLDIPLIERLLRAITTPILPLLFLQRWGQRYWSRKRRRREFVLTLPLQLLLFGRWAAGEFAGYCFGSSRSCEILFY